MNATVEIGSAVICAYFDDSDVAIVAAQRARSIAHGVTVTRLTAGIDLVVVMGEREHLDHVAELAVVLVGMGGQLIELPTVVAEMMRSVRAAALKRPDAGES